MQASGNDRVELASYLWKDIAHIRYIEWKENRGANSSLITWDCFSETILDKLLPIELKEAKAQEFMNLMQGNMTVQEYRLKFNQLSRYAPQIVADFRAMINTLFYGELDLVKTECRNAMLLSDMKISRLIIHFKQVEGDKLREYARKIRRLGMGTMTILSRNRIVDIAYRVRKCSVPAPSSASASSSENIFDQKGRAPGSMSQGFEENNVQIVLGLVRYHIH